MYTTIAIDGGSMIHAQPYMLYYILRVFFVSTAQPIHVVQDTTAAGICSSAGRPFVLYSFLLGSEPWKFFPCG